MEYKQNVFFFNYVVYFSFWKKELALALFHGFCSPKIMTP